MWRASVLVQAVLAVPVSVGTNVSSLLGQLDRHRDVIRNFADTDEAKQVCVYKYMYVYVNMEGGRRAILLLLTLYRCVCVCACVCACMCVNVM